MHAGNQGPARETGSWRKKLESDAKSQTPAVETCPRRRISRIVGVHAPAIALPPRSIGVRDRSGALALRPLGHAPRAFAMGPALRWFLAPCAGFSRLQPDPHAFARI